MTPTARFLAVPSDITMNGPFINVDAFNEAGVAMPTEWTWDEMIAAATEVQEANGMEFALAIDKSGHRISTVLQPVRHDAARRGRRSPRPGRPRPR